MYIFDIPRRVKANSLQYVIWDKQGYIISMEGNVIHCDFIENFIIDLSERYHILEIAVYKWKEIHAIHNFEDNSRRYHLDRNLSLCQNLQRNFIDCLEGEIIHAGDSVMR